MRKPAPVRPWPPGGRRPWPPARRAWPPSAGLWNLSRRFDREARPAPGGGRNQDVVQIEGDQAVLDDQQRRRPDELANRDAETWPYQPTAQGAEGPALVDGPHDEIRRYAQNIGRAEYGDAGES